MTALGLFDFDSQGAAVVRDTPSFPDPASVAAHEEHAQQTRQLARVTGRTEGAILAVLGEWGAGTVFTASELLTQVAAKVGQVAPASVDRVLRQCRAKGLCSYRVNRAASRYLLESISLEVKP